MRFKRVSAAILVLALGACGGGDSAPSERETVASTPAAEDLAPLPGPRETPTPLPTEYVAHGNEPFWRVETTADRITYSTPEQIDGVELAAAGSQVDGWARFEARLDGAPLILEVRRGQCFDGMSGFEFSHEARLTRADGTWTGCARLASEPQPRE